MRETMPTVLLATLHATLRPVQQRALSRLPVRVITATTQEATQQLVVRHRPAVLLLCAPAGRAWRESICRSVADAAGKTRILVITQQSSAHEATALLRVGASDYLSAAASGRAFVTMMQRALATVATAEDPLAQSLRTNTQILARISHELRTPLMTTQGYLELLKKHQGTLPTEKVLDFIDRSLEAMGEVTQLADMLMQVLRLEEVHEPATARVVLLQVVTAALRQCGPLASGRVQVTLTDSLAVTAAPLALQQVVRNLVTNALKYSPDGGSVTISATTEPAGMIDLTVRDEGIGIAAEHLPHLFSRFARVHDRDRWPAIEGNGLGLYICRHLIDAMGGQIWVESAPGKGSVFHVSLPDARPADTRILAGALRHTS